MNTRWVTAEDARKRPRSAAPDLAATIRAGGLIPHGGRVVVGVSGGPDSMALLHALARLAPGMEFALVVAHLDHGLRDDSRADAEFVREQAGRLGVEAILERSDVRGLARQGHRSLEDAGRRARYAFFERVAAARGCELVAVGHTADDQAETVLFGMLRGGGLDAVAGMPPERPLSRRAGAPRLVRPLLGVWRDEVLAYCERFAVPFVEDASNRSRSFTRNRIRHDLLPLLAKEYNPQVRRHLVQLARLARESADLQRELAAELLARARVTCRAGVAFDMETLRSRPAPLAAAALRLAFAEATGGEASLDWAATARVVRLLAPGGPRAVELIAGWRAEVGPGARLWLHPGPAETLRRITPRLLPLPGRVEMPEAGLYLEAAWADPPAEWPEERDVAFIDPAAVAGELRVRAPERGDRFQPFGLRGSRKLSDFLIDRKVPREARGAVPVVADAGKILWVAGMRLDERARLPPVAERAIRLVLGRLRG